MKVLLASVGGTVAPLVSALEALRPDGAIWLVSKESEATLERIPAHLRARFQHQLRTPEAEDLAATFEALHGRLPHLLADLGAAWEDVTADITGGTKPMSAAVALAAIHGVRCFHYIGGTTRDEGGVGRVEEGAERPIAVANPWDELAITSLRQVTDAFNSGDFPVALQILRTTRSRVSREDVRVRLEAFEVYVQGFEAWDRFDYETSHARLQASRNLILAWAGQPQGSSLIRQRESAVKRVQEILSSLREEAPSTLLLEDLLANAIRRGESGRYDDAVARLYRFLEGLAQAALFDDYGLQTRAMPIADLPGGPDWDSKRKEADEKGIVKLGLHDTYRLLAHRGHKLGGDVARRLERGRDVFDLLQARNLSLLAHGTRPVERKRYEQFLRVCLGLVSLTDESLYSFPRLTA